MKEIFIFLALSSIIYAEKLKVPSWVPEEKKVLFMALIKETKELQKYSKEYSDFLKDKPRIISCKIDGDSIIVGTKRGNIEEEFIIVYSITPSKCEIKDKKLAKLEFENKQSFWDKVEDYSIKIGIGLILGFFLGKA